MKKFNRVFVPHPNFRFGTDNLRDLAKEIVYVCETPMFDDLMGDEHSTKFEGKINETMSNFNPDLDVVADYGDAIIFAMMIFYLSERFEGFPVARFSNKRNEYVVREISTEQFLVESK